MRTLLLVSTRPVWPALDGISLRQAALLRHLRAQWKVVLASPDDPAAIDSTALDEHESLTATAHWHPAPTPHRPGPAQADLGHLIDALDPAAMLFWVGSERLGFGRPRQWPAAVVDRIDAMSLYTLRDMRRRAPFLRRQDISTLATYLAYERRVVRSFPRTVVVAEDDQRALRRISGLDRIDVIPNGVDTQPLAGGEHPVPTVTFTGVMDYPPNVVAITRFARTVWPRVRAQHPSARLVIAGRRPHVCVRELEGAPGIEVTGEVPDMIALLREAWVVVAPMQSGTGIKNKVLEGWSVGRPVVMTTLATNGLTPCPGAAELVVDDAEGMAGRISALLSDPQARGRTGELLHAHVQQHHSWGMAGARLSGVLELAIEEARLAPSRPVRTTVEHQPG